MGNYLPITIRMLLGPQNFSQHGTKHSTTQDTYRRSQTEIQETVKDSYLWDNYYKTFSYFLSGKKISHVELPRFLKCVEEEQGSKIKKIQLIMQLNHNCIGDLGCLALRKSQLTNIAFLNLSSNQIGDKGCHELTKWNLPELACLFLHENNITENGCASLSKSQWNNLKSIGLQDNPIGRQGYIVIQNKYSRCKIWCDEEYMQFQ